jgi:hypothetical protein
MTNYRHFENAILRQKLTILRKATPFFRLKTHKRQKEVAKIGKSLSQ